MLLLEGGVIKFKLPPVESPLDDATDVVPWAQTGTLRGEAAHPMQSSDSLDALLQTQLQSSSRRGPGCLLPLLLTILEYNYGSSEDGLEGQEKSFASHFSLDSPLRAERRRGYEFLPAPVTCLGDECCVPPFSARWSMRARAGAIMPPVPCVPGHRNLEPSNGLQSNFLRCLEPPCSADSRNAFGVTLSKTSCSLLRGTQFLFSAFLLSWSLGSDPLHDIVSSVCSTNILGVFLLCEVWGLPCDQGRCTHVHGPLFQGRSWSQA